MYLHFCSAWLCKSLCGLKDQKQQGVWHRHHYSIVKGCFATVTSTEGRNIYQGRSEEEERDTIVKLRINCLRELDPDDVPAVRRGGVGRAELPPPGVQSRQAVCCLLSGNTQDRHLSFLCVAFFVQQP